MNHNSLYAILTLAIVIVFYYFLFKLIIKLLKKLAKAFPIKINIEIGKNPEDKLRKP